MPDIPEIICRPASILARIDFTRLFPNSYPVELELGSGDGTFIVDWAARNPGRNLVGIERLLGRLRKIERKARRLNLENLRAIRIEAGYFMQYLIAPGSLAAIHVYFPDPWPKRRHWRRRLINREFVDQAAKALAPGGIVYTRTDNADYFAQITDVFGGSPRFQAVDTPPELAQVLTDFERDFLARGIQTRHAAYRCGHKRISGSP